MTPAWHGAPSAENVTILFTFIDSLTTLKKWQDCINSMSVLNEAIGQLSLVVRTVLAFLRLWFGMQIMTLNRFVQVRSLLVEHSGYEVEGEEGNFVCAFGVSCVFVGCFFPLVNRICATVLVAR